MLGEQLRVEQLRDFAGFCWVLLSFEGRTVRGGTVEQLRVEQLGLGKSWTLLGSLGWFISFGQHFVSSVAFGCFWLFFAAFR